MDNSAATTERRKTFRNLSVVILFCSLLGCCLLEAAFASDGENFEAAFQGQCPRGASDGICQHICRNHSPRTFACYCLPGFHLQHNGYACTNETESLTAAPTSTMIQSFSVLKNVPQDKFALEALSARQSRCSEVKCRNGGWCDEGNKEDATCSCPLGRTGKYCHQRTSFSTPHFSGRSSAMLSLLANRRNGSRFDIAVTIRPESPDGLFFFVGHSLESNTKLIVLSLVDAYVILRILLGDNTIVIQSRSRVKLNETLHVEAGRKGASDFYLRVGLQELQMTSKPEVESKELDLTGNVYIGGVPDSNTLQQEILRQDYAESRKLFRGCIVRLAIDGKAFVLQPPPFGDIVDGINVDRCNDIITDDSTEEPPCRTECLNGGRCIRSNDGQESFCDCAAGFVGLQCEIDLESNIPFFNGSSHLSYEIGQMRDHIKHRFYLRLIFRPSKRLRPSAGGEILLHVGNTKKTSAVSLDRSFVSSQHFEDFLMVGLKDGFVEVSVNFGDATVVARSREVIRLGVWCEVEVRRTGRLLELYVDNKLHSIVSSPGSFAEFSLNNDPYIYLGGVPSGPAEDDKQTDGGVGLSFHGCIDLKKSAFMDERLTLSKAKAGFNLESVCPG